MALHQLKDNGNILLPKRIVPIVLAGEVDEVIAVFPETKTAFLKAKDILDRAYFETVTLWNTAKDLTVQKDYALLVKDNPVSGLLFQMRKKHPQGTEQELRRLWRASDELLVKAYFGDETFTFDTITL